MGDPWGRLPASKLDTWPLTAEEVGRRVKPTFGRFSCAYAVNLPLSWLIRLRLTEPGRSDQVVIVQSTDTTECVSDG
jgi:hypothetical protein